MPNFAKGAEAVAKAQERKNSGGDFTIFTPKIFWDRPDSDHYVLFLNPLSDVPQVDMINFIKQTGTKRDGSSFTYYEQTLARTEPGRDNPADTDPMVETWKASPKQTNVAVAVELEPVTEKNERGRERPVSFKVKTTEFERRVRDAEGELTDETETAFRPAVGFITQSPHNFFNIVTSFDAKEGPIHEVPSKITQVGSGSDTTYTMVPFDGLPIDLGDLIEYIDGINYLSPAEQDILYDAIDGMSDKEAVLEIGAFLLDKRMDELDDDERYDRLLGSITEEFRQFGKKKGKGGDSKERKPRTSRRSQRKSEDDPDSEPEATPDPEPQEEAPAPRARRGRKPAEKPAEEGPKQESGPAQDKLAALRERAEKRRANK